MILSLWVPVVAMTNAPLVIAHRGFPGELPEHTMEGYRRAIEVGADYIEPDLIITKDGILIARHENELNLSTDVKEKFPDRKTKKVVDGKPVEGWFAEDFTFAEIQTLRARQVMINRSKEFDGKYLIPSFEQVLELVTSHNATAKKPVGIYPETKHPSYFRSIGLAIEEPLLKLLKKYKLDRPDSPVFVQSFEVENLRALRRKIPVKLIQLVGEAGERPYDWELAGDRRTYGDLVSDDGLKFIKSYADGIGAWKGLIVQESSFGQWLRSGSRRHWIHPSWFRTLRMEPTDLVTRAKANGLLVHVWTLRDDQLPAEYDREPRREFQRFMALGVDGFFTDFPRTGVAALAP